MKINGYFFFFFSLIKNYCHTKGVERNSVRFMLNNKEILEEDSPESVGMIKGNKISVLKR